MNSFVPFSGSYAPGDVEFILRPVEIDMTPVELKEELIQSGKRHYSEMLSQEPSPSSTHIDIYNNALASGGKRMASECVAIAKSLKQAIPDEPIILVSLVRAGVPLGVVLHQTLSSLGYESHHYGISIIRDRGIDNKALAYIEEKHGTSGIVFVDGWTGKGAITGELIKSLHSRPGYPKQPRLVVLADPCGCAWLSASGDDWLIPFGILGAPVSGMVSRSIWSADDYHGCVRTTHLTEFECSQHFVDVIAEHRKSLAFESIKPCVWSDADRASLSSLSKSVIDSVATQFEITSTNRIKPGIAEATRAVLRRVPDHVLIKDLNDPDVQLLIHLAESAGVQVTEAGKALGPYRALTIIKKVS